MSYKFEPKEYKELVLYNHLLTHGDFFELNCLFDPKTTYQEIKKFDHLWRPYNLNKTDYKRYGMSLFSLDGGTSGEIDLNSVLDYNKRNGTSYEETSFRTPTEAWHGIPAISSPLRNLEPFLCRSHLIRFGEGGFFPPHRDLGQAFRLIAFIDNSDESVYMTMDKRVLPINCGRLYFMNIRKEHAIVSFVEGSTILVLNVEISEGSVNWVLENLLAH